MDLKWLKNRKHLLIMPAYFVFYMAMFTYVESYDGRCNILHTQWDDMIPFCEYFIVPYVLWYVYLAGTVMWFGMKEGGRDEHNRLAAALCTGMTIFLIISLVYPNGQDLRPSLEELEGGNVFMEAVRFLYTIDTSTNILPSIHVFNSLACCGAWLSSERYKSNKALAVGNVLLTGVIIASTMFLKQHSVIDVAAGFVLYGVCWILFYSSLPEIVSRRTAST